MSLSVDAPAVSSIAPPQPAQAPAAPAAPGAPAATGADARAARVRDPYYDNVKFLAVMLVVLGHAWYALDGSRLTGAAHLFVYTFHLPAFILIAGFFSRRFATARSKVRRLVVGIGVPYLIFEAAYPLFAHVFNGNRFLWTPLSPYWITWFLLALFIWRLSTPLWQQLRWPLPVAVGISVVSGLMQLPDQAAYRVLGFLPFFVAGLLLRDEHIQWLRTRRVRMLAVLVTLAAGTTSLLVVRRMDNEWLSYRADYAELGVSALAGMAMRLGTLACGLAMVAAFLALTPRRRMWFTPLGGRSMYVYLLHGFFIFGATYAGWYGWAERLGTIGGFAVVSALALLLGLVLATRPVRWAFRWVIEPRLDWAFRR